jgi:hypothetical protein
MRHDERKYGPHFIAAQGDAGKFQELNEWHTTVRLPRYMVVRRNRIDKDIERVTGGEHHKPLFFCLQGRLAYFVVMRLKNASARAMWAGSRKCREVQRQEIRNATSRQWWHT